MWGRRVQTGSVRWRRQTANMQTTTARTLLFVTQDPSTYKYTTTSSNNAGNNGNINGINVTPRENSSNADMFSIQGNIVGVNGVNVTPPTKTTTQSNGNSTRGMNGIDVHVTPLENTKTHTDAGITKATIRCSSPSPLMDSKVSSR